MVPIQNFVNPHENTNPPRCFGNKYVATGVNWHKSLLNLWVSKYFFEWWEKYIYQDPLLLFPTKSFLKAQINTVCTHEHSLSCMLLPVRRGEKGALMSNRSPSLYYYYLWGEICFMSDPFVRLPYRVVVVRYPACARFTKFNPVPCWFYIYLLS